MVPVACQCSAFSFVFYSLRASCPERSGGGSQASFEILRRDFTYPGIFETTFFFLPGLVWKER